MNNNAHRWHCALLDPAKLLLKELLYVGLGLTLCATASFADTKTYVVDLVIVTPTSSQWLKEEVFPTELPAPWRWFNQTFPVTAAETFLTTDPIDPINTVRNPMLNATRLSTHPGHVQQRLLEQAQTRLTRSGHYRVLYQGSFVQEFKALDQATRYWMQSESQVRGQPELAGWITFYRGRFLHLHSEMLLTQIGRQLVDLASNPQPPTSTLPLPTANLESTDEPSEIPLIKEQYWVKRIPVEHRQKLKSGEIYYLDHPGLGILIKLSPLGT